MTLARLDRSQVVSIIILLAIATPFVFVWVTERQRAAYEATPEYKAEQTRAEVANQQNAIKVAGEMMIGLKLRDPDSAVFSGERAFKKDGKSVLCGMVNSRNAFGGMAGPELFAVVDADAYLVSEGGVAFDMIGRACGIDPPGSKHAPL